MTHSGLLRTSTVVGLGTVLAAAVLAGCASAGSRSNTGGSTDGSAVTRAVTGGQSAPVPSTGSMTASGSVATAVSPPPGVGTRQVGLGASGSTIVLRVGQTLAVTLGPHWTPPQAGIRAPGVATAPQPLRMISSVGFPAAGTAAATFAAVRAGTATVTAHTDYACLHTRPRCLPPQELFTLTVRVLPPT